MADARTGIRFPVELPVRIHVLDTAEEQAGTTTNVSAAGVYLKAGYADGSAVEHPWRPGAAVEFEMTLPAGVIGSRADVHIHCRGRIVRIEKLKGEQARDGVACVIDKYDFVRKP